MTYWSVIGSPAGDAVQIAAFLLAAVQLLVWVAAGRMRAGVRFRAGAALHAAAGGFLLSILLHLSWVRANPDRDWAKHSAIARAFAGMPLAAVLILIGASLAALALCGFLLYRYSGEHLTAGAVKETIDNLPAGVCFGEESGTVALSNVKMNELARAVTGRPLRNLRELEKRTADGRPVSANGKIWQFTCAETAVRSRPYRQISAVDITERAHLTEELEAKNRALREIRMRMQAYSAESDELVRSQEILNAKIAVHDELGHALLACRYYLEHPEKMDEAALLEILMQTNYFLTRDADGADEETGSPASGGAAPEFGASAGAEPHPAASGMFGVTVRILGTEPSDGPAREIFAAAVRECSANAAKHAGARHLFAEIRETSGPGALWRFVFTNDGACAGHGEIREAGGLLSLRRLTEQAGGSMLVSADPRFRVEIRLPK